MTSTAACLILAGAWILVLAFMIGLAWASGRGDREAAEVLDEQRLVWMREQYEAGDGIELPTFAPEDWYR